MLARLFAATAVLAAWPVHAATVDSEVLAPVHAFFDGMAKYDREAMRATVQSEGSVALLRQGKVVRHTLGEFIDGIAPGKARIEERIYDPLVRVDGDLAVVWARYDFRVDGVVKHCGTDLIHLVKMDGKWVIAGVADNNRESCSGNDRRSS